MRRLLAWLRRVFGLPALPPPPPSAAPPVVILTNHLHPEDREDWDDDR